MNPEELRRLLQKPEGEGLEFKPGLLSRKEIAEYAVGIGNSGGGLLIMGVSDKLPRRVLSCQAVSERELDKIRRSVADKTQIHVDVEMVIVPEGTVVVVSIPPRPRGIPFHTRDGKFLIRLADGLRGMSLPELDSIRREAGSELTASVVPGTTEELLSAAALEELRSLMREAQATTDLEALDDRDLLSALGVTSDSGGLTLAGLLLAGKSEAIRIHAPFAQWQFFKMAADTGYTQAESGFDSIPVALRRLRELMAPFNPVLTIPGWLVHPEFPLYPVLALRELLVNAFVHRDYAVPGAVTLKLFSDRLELSNPGGLVGGVTPQNILHHPSAPRYPTLFLALSRMRLANAANLGVPRVYRELLSEGKEPPIYWASQRSVSVTVKAQETRPEFLQLLNEHPDLDVDDLLIVHHLTRHRELATAKAAQICQRPLEIVEEHLSALTVREKLLESCGRGKGRYFRLSRATYKILLGSLQYLVDRRLSMENARARVLAALKDRDLSNRELREVTQLGRDQVLWLMKGLAREGLVALEGEKRASRWRLARRS